MLSRAQALSLLLITFSTRAGSAQEIQVDREATRKSVWSVPPEGPALTLSGSGAFVVGSLLSASGAAQSSCDDGECGGRFALLLTGAGLSGLLGGLGMGLGARIWRRDLGEAPEVTGIEYPRADPSARRLGITLVVLGASSYAVGLFGSTIGAQNGSGATYYLGGPLGASLIGLGSLGVAFGAPMTHLADRRVPPQQLMAVVPVIGPGGVGLSGAF